MWLAHCAVSWDGMSAPSEVGTTVLVAEFLGTTLGTWLFLSLFHHVGLFSNVYAFAWIWSWIKIRIAFALWLVLVQVTIVHAVLSIIRAWPERWFVAVMACLTALYVVLFSYVWYKFGSVDRAVLGFRNRVSNALNVSTKDD